jgi:hypothetical protein
MLEWKIFYKMLDIPEDVTEPTYYDLLGVDSDACNAELVDSMLRRRRSLLRQNIPGPQFIPLVRKFEQKKLEKAATVLRNPELRQKYNRYLQQKARKRRSEELKERNGRREADAPEHEPVEKGRVDSQSSQRRRRILPAALVITASSILVVSVLFLLISGGRNHPKPESPLPDTSSAHTSTSSELQQEPLASDPPERAETPDSVETGEIVAKDPGTQEGNGPSPPVQRKLRITAEDVRKSYSTIVKKDALDNDPATREHLLADLAVTMDMCYHRAKQFISGPAVAISENSRLNRQLQMRTSARVGDIMEQVELISMPLAELTNEDSPGPEGSMTVEELLTDVKERINTLKRKTRNPPESMTSICRNLYQLSKLSDPGISERLRAITPTSFKRIDLAITDTIDKLSGKTLSSAVAERSGRTRYSFSHPMPPGRITQQHQNKTAKLTTWQPDPNGIKLLAVTAHYAGLTSNQLRDEQTSDRKRGTTYSRSADRPEIYCSASDVGRKLLEELDNIFKRLAFLTTLHPDGQYSNKVRAIAGDTTGRKLACRTVLQKAVVILDATGETLELLVDQLEQTEEIEDDLEQARRLREQSRLTIDNVLHELRESCYYNLRLWDILVEHNNHRIPALPQGGRWPAHSLDLPSSQESINESEQRQQRLNDALDDLRKGLNAYIDGRYEVAKERLNKAMSSFHIAGRGRQSHYVKAWADSELLTALDEVHNKCVKIVEDVSNCRKCEGSGLDACQACYGSGWRRCPQCRGRGKIMTGTMTYPCRNCRGKGYAKCEKCNGEPFHECELCSSRAGIGSHERQAIEEVITKAVYLQNGGIDLFTPNAFEPSPAIHP